VTKVADGNQSQLRAARLEQGLTLIETARRAGVSKQSVWRCETGRPVAAHIRKLLALVLLEKARP
jgi:transcriptional regulator with XRE-family HTH domain